MIQVDTSSTVKLKESHLEIYPIKYHIICQMALMTFQRKATGLSSSHMDIYCPHVSVGAVRSVTELI